MKILRCLFCGGEVSIVKEYGYAKTVKCANCCHGCEGHNHKVKEPEIYIYRKRS